MLARFTITQDDWFRPRVTEAHCLRVAALGQEIASRLGLADYHLEMLHATALTHHSQTPVLSEDAYRRLKRDLFEVNAHVTADSGHDIVSSVFEVAHGFEQGLEFSPYEYKPASAILEELEELGASGFLHADSVRVLKELEVDSATMESVRTRLPVCPSVLPKAIAVVQNDEASINDIERVIRRDQVLAASLLRVANSAFFAPERPIITIRQAISRVGLNMAKRVLMAAALRPLIVSSPLQDLWQHSLEVAAAAERIARQSTSIDPGEAFVAGLLHDIGRLLIHLLPAEPAAAHQRIAQAAACPVLADLAITGRDHGELGAAVLQEWGLPPALVVAIEFHHRPELKRASLAPLLYLAEFVAGGDEDIVSFARLKLALDIVGVKTIADLFGQDQQVGALALAG